MTDDTKLILSKLDKITEDVSELKTDVSELKTDVSGLKTDVSGLKTDVSGLKTSVASLEEKYETLSSDVHNIHLTLENVTNKNISIIAENHLSLNEKLNKCLRTESEKAMMLVRLNFLESDMSMIKQRLNISA